MPKAVIIIFLLFTTSVLHAQSWEIGAYGGAAGYMGDLNQTNPLKLSGPAIGGMLRYNFNGYLSARVNYTYGTIAGADSTSSNIQQRTRNLSFSTSLSELSIIGEFNFFKYIPSISSSYFSPYIYLGIGTTTFIPHANYQGQTYDLTTLQTEGQTKPYSNNAISIPYGVGIKYNFSGAWTIAADIGYRNTNTDYLDDVSGLYPNKANLSPLSAALSDRSGEKTGVYTGTGGTQRGDFRGFDTYLFVGFTVSFTFISSKCYY